MNDDTDIMVRLSIEASNVNVTYPTLASAQRIRQLLTEALEEIKYLRTQTSESEGQEK